MKSLDTQATIVYFVDDQLQIVQLHCETMRVGMFGIDVGPCRDQAGGAGSAVDLIAGGGTVPPVPQNGRRTYRVTLKNVILVGSPPGDLELSASVGGAPGLRVSAEQNQFANRKQIVIAPVRIGNVAAVLQAIAQARDKIRITYEFAKDDPELPVVLGVAAVELTPKGDPTSIVLTPTIAMPRRPKKYAVKVEVPAAGTAIPAGVLPPGSTALTGSTSVEFIPATLDRAASSFYFEAAYTSTIDVATSKRSNAGVFALHVRPTFAVVSSNVDGAHDGSSSWWALRPLLDADVDTRPIAASKVPNRILLGLGHDWGWDVGLRPPPGDTPSGPPFLQQVILTNGFHYESDRDFNLQTAYWHVEFRPAFLNWEQTREQRLMAFGHWLERQPADAVTRKQPRVSSYYVRPSIAHDLGGVARDRNDVKPNAGDTISRTPWRLEAAVELLRTLTFAVTHDYHVIWTVDDDRGRSYVEARAELNTGTLLRLDRGSLQHAITFKYQRGRQSPAFKQVDTLSIGVRLFR